jgi:hypothetical protein
MTREGLPGKDVEERAFRRASQLQGFWALAPVVFALW